MSIRTSPARDNSPTTEVQVATTTVAEMFAEFGVPHYLKCDIEGADKIVCDQVAVGSRSSRNFVSFEDEYGELAKILAAAGYDRFQFINQGRLHKTRLPKPPREGQFADAQFDGASSPACSAAKLIRGTGLDLPGSRAPASSASWIAMRERRVNPLVEYACRRVGKAFRLRLAGQDRLGRRARHARGPADRLLNGMRSVRGRRTDAPSTWPRAFGQRSAVVEHVHAVGEVGHHLHVVLDPDHRACSSRA